ncbi:putative excinuclease ATPase subunit [Cylindrospermum sp. NIES-4074]|nr:putative excinuclease ATPase subunit [Cylindrospermum sp. NIES-4074]
MRIKQISVTELFGIFNHVIPMNMEDRITIIYGLNGVGKTALLRMVNGLLNLRYLELNSIPFKDFQIDFDDSSYIRVSKTPKQGIDNIQQHQLTLFFKKNSRSKEQSFPLNKLEAKALQHFPIASILDDIVPGLERISSSIWRYLPTNEEISLEDALERFGYLLPKQFRQEKTPDWLENIRNSIHIRFIESQRLLNLSDISKSRMERSRPSMIPSVATYANELAKNIQINLAEYGALAQSLDRTFPVRVVQQEASSDMTDIQLRNKLNELEEKRSHLINTGLLDKDDNTNFQIQKNLDESTKKLLSVYVEDVEKKLGVFDDLAKKIELMKRIINQRFSYKQINISKDKGFTFTCNGNSLVPENLSSGEQHELVILYELLFKVKPNSLILIDEPELSLHIAWQVQFLKDLREITEIATLDVLIATHSPDIIHDRWDLTVELKGPHE